MYRDRVLALAAHWKLGVDSAAVLKMLPDERRTKVEEAGTKSTPEKSRAAIASLTEREHRRTNLWGRKRYGAAAWDRLDPRARAWLVQEHGGDHQRLRG